MTASTTDPPRLARPAALLRPMVTAGALVLVLFLAPFPTASLWSGGFLLDARPWILAGAGALLLSVLFWLPIVRGQPT